MAILAVVLYHAFGPMFGYFLPWNGFFRDVAASPSETLLWFYPVTWAWIGVPLFFVLSGFCIHASFLRARRFDGARFFWRRFWRLYPAYGVALVFFSLRGHVSVQDPGGWKQIWTHVLFVQNFSWSTFYGINGCFWSLATEVQLYLLFPALLFLRARIGIANCLVVTMAAGLLWRMLAVRWWGLPDHVITPAFSSPLVTWFDWTLGAFVAERLAEGRVAFERKALWLLGLAPLFVVSTLYKPLTIFSFTLAAALSAVVLDAALRLRWDNVLAARPLGFLGAISYSWYLWHQPFFTGSFAKDLFIVIPLTILLSWLSYRFVERAGLNIGHRLFRGKS